MKIRPMSHTLYPMRKNQTHIQETCSYETNQTHIPHTLPHEKKSDPYPKHLILWEKVEPIFRTLYPNLVYDPYPIQMYNWISKKNMYRPTLFFQRKKTSWRSCIYYISNWVYQLLMYYQSHQTVVFLRNKVDNITLLYKINIYTSKTLNVNHE